MKAGNFAIELAEHRVAEERDAGVKSIRAEVASAGAFECIDCDRKIPEARRLAAPFAKRCIRCQEIHEHEMRRSA